MLQGLGSEICMEAAEQPRLSSSLQCPALQIISLSAWSQTRMQLQLFNSKKLN